jgi:3'-phosphoadenosine 5'-phosphosulfate sulfotransferase (PAPS reductase)/FAD synthetase
MTAYSPRLEKLVIKAKKNIEDVLKTKSNPLVAYSGGKDGNVTMSLVNSVKKTKGVCETSFYFQRQLQDIKNTAQKNNFDVDFQNSFDWSWLSKHREIIFTTNAKARSKSFAIRQQKVVQDYSKRFNHDIVFFGRRKQENTVRQMSYPKNGVLQFFPIREWTNDDIWEYLDKTPNMGRPWVYSYFDFNGPFYAVRVSLFNYDYDKAWDFCSSLDPNIKKENLNVN